MSKLALPKRPHLLLPRRAALLGLGASFIIRPAKAQMSVGIVGDTGHAAGPSNPFTLVAHTAATADNSPVLTSAIDTTGANLLVVGVSGYNGNSGVLGDSKLNSWTTVAADETSGVGYSSIYYKYAPIVGAAHTFTLTGSPGGIYSSIAVQAWSGAGAALNSVSGAVTAGATSLQPGSLTPGAANRLIAITICGTPLDALAIDSSFTIEDFSISAGDFGIGLAYLKQGAAAAINPTWSVTTSQALRTTMGVFA